LAESEQKGIDPAVVPWLAIVAACGLVFFASAGLCWSESPQPWWEMGWGMQCPVALRTFGALDLGRLWLEGQWWRVATTGFVHGSALHLTLNMWSLLVIGPWASRAWGHVAAVFCFAASSVVGVLASAAWAEAPVVVGASAGILGLAGGLWVSRGWGAAAVRERVAPVSTRGLGTTLALMVGLGFMVPMIAQAGHLGGLAMGLLLGAGLSAVGGQGRRRFWWAGACLALVAAASLSVRPRWRSNYSAFQGFVLVEQEHYGDALPLLEDALEREPGDAVLLNGVAYALAEAGVELTRAGELADAALELEPDNADIVDTKGWVLCRLGQPDQGLEWIRRASELSEGGVDEIEEHLETCEQAAVFHVKH